MNSAPSALKLIDSDVHNALASPNDLLPFLSGYWREEVKARGMNIPHAGYVSPVGVLREDARPDDTTGGPGSSPAFLMKDHMDRYGIDYAVLTGSGMLSLSLHNDPDYGTALAAALNEWLVVTWLDFSPRFRGSIIINHSDPVAAIRPVHVHAVVVGQGARIGQVDGLHGAPRPVGALHDVEHHEPSWFCVRTK